MELVRSRLDRDANDSAHEVSELGGSVLRDHVEFFDGVHARGISDKVIRHLIVIQTVEQEVVRLLPDCR